MAIGYKPAGMPGLLVAGGCFILPAAGLTLLLAWLYVRYATLPWLQPALAGLAPAVVVVMAQGAWRLGRDAVRSAVDVATMIVVCGLALYGVSEMALLVGAAVVGALLPFHTRGMAMVAVVVAAVPLIAAAVQPPATSRQARSSRWRPLSAISCSGPPAPSSRRWRSFCPRSCSPRCWGR